jgi:hypothetical protein
MPHTFETAPTGRAKCRGCNALIAKGELRFGERVPNPYGDGEATLWFHPICGMYKRPEAFLDALGTNDVTLPDRDRLEREAREGIAHRRLPRIDGAERAPSGRAHCRSCREVITKGEWRFSLVYFEEGRFQPSGYVHAKCSKEYFGTVDILERVRHFGRLEEGEVEDIRRVVGA